MAVILTEGFDHMIASLLTAKGWSVNPTSVNAGRFSGNASRLAAGTSLKTLPATYTEAYLGFAYRYGAGSPATSDVCVLQTAGAVNAFRVGVVLSSGHLLFRILTSGGTVVATGTTPILVSTWYYVEAHALINGASGSCSLHLNGVAGEIADTVGNFGSTAVTSVGFTGANTTDVDDVYVADTTGSAPRNTFLGDVRVETVYPSADGAHTAWTPNSGSPHFSRVNEHTSTFPDGDTSYVSDSTPGDYDTYDCDDLSVSSGTVYAVQTNLYARKDDAGVRQIAPVVRQGGTDHDGTTVTLGSSYAFFSQIYNQDPVAADWTIANVNADEFGVKEVS